MLPGLNERLHAADLSFFRVPTIILLVPPFTLNVLPTDYTVSISASFLDLRYLEQITKINSYLLI